MVNQQKEYVDANVNQLELIEETKRKTRLKNWNYQLDMWRPQSENQRKGEERKEMEKK